MPRLPPSPQLSWTDEGTPRAGGYDDVYFSRLGGLAEAAAVFLGGCGLPEGWAGRTRFSICELGFGAGLNALAVWRAWKATRTPPAILHMCSVEAHPLERADAARALAAFPEVAELAAQLLARWPVRAYGAQRLWFPEDGFVLTVLAGEAAAVLAELEGGFDAFFLDGFSPARNPAMWSEPVMAELARLAAPGARAATFSVAAAVRQGLKAAGFQVDKRPGFGAKRERLEAVFAARSHPRQLGVLPYAPCRPSRVAIVGAGIAGAAAAAALARRGVETVVLEAAEALGAGASGNACALVMPRLDRGGVLKDFFLSAFLDAVATYERLGVFTSCGVVEQPPLQRNAFDDLLGDPPLPLDWFAPAPDGALHVRAGLVDSPAALRAMLGHARVMLDTPVAAVERVGQGWRMLAPDGRTLLDADAVVLACGPALGAFDAASFLPLQLSLGQIEYGPAAHAPMHAITRGAYVAPWDEGVVFGATFDPLEASPATEANADARTRNLRALAALAPELASRLDPALLRSRASVRASTPDRAPIAGLLPDASAWIERYAALAHGRAVEAEAPPPAHDGLYVLSGLGARGFTYAPMLGERLAAEMFGEPQAIGMKELAALHPARFLVRALKRGQLP